MCTSHTRSAQKPARWKCPSTLLVNAKAPYGIDSAISRRSRKLSPGAVSRYGACAEIMTLSLPDLPSATQVRPGYLLTLRLPSKLVRFLSVHLKADIEDLANGVDYFVVLGDFNRNLWHDANVVLGAEPLRNDGQTDLTTGLAANVLSRNLLSEVNDGTPATSKFRLLFATCPGDATVEAACNASTTTVLSASQRNALTAKRGLGCRNPIGRDHILVSEGLIPRIRSVSKVPIGAFGESFPPKPPGNPDPVLAVSDHCPLVVELEL